MVRKSDIHEIKKITCFFSFLTEKKLHSIITVLQMEKDASKTSRKEGNTKLHIHDRLRTGSLYWHNYGAKEVHDLNK